MYKILFLWILKYWFRVSLPGPYIEMDIEEVERNAVKQKVQKSEKKEEEKKEEELEVVEKEASLDMIFEMEDSDEEEKIFAEQDDSDDDPLNNGGMGHNGNTK